VALVAEQEQEQAAVLALAALAQVAPGPVAQVQGPVVPTSASQIRAR
jgi:hypothetical protein